MTYKTTIANVDNNMICRSNINYNINVIDIITTVELLFFDR